jgi:hypothetical protein
MRLRVTPKDGDIEKLKGALVQFAEMSDKAYKKTAETWQKRLKRVPTIRGGQAQFPELHFDWLYDENDDKSLIYFVSAPTPTAWKFFKMPQKKMEKELKGYLKDIHGIEAKLKFIGD